MPRRMEDLPYGFKHTEANWQIYHNVLKYHTRHHTGPIEDCLQERLCEWAAEFITNPIVKGSKHE